MFSPRPSQQRIFPRALLLAWMFLLGAIGTGLVGPNLLSVERELGLRHGQVGAAFAAVQVACSAAALILAAAVPRLGSVRALLAGLVIQGAGFGVVYASRGVEMLALGWTLITFGTVLGAVANNLSARLWAEEPRRGVTLLHGFNGIGKVAGPLIAVLCLGLGWRLSFLVFGGITLALLAALWLGRGRLAVFAPPTTGKSGLDAAVLRRPLYWLCILPFGLIAGGDVCFAALLPAYYENTRSVSPGGAGLLLMVHLVGLAVGRFTFVALSRRLTNNQVIGLCLASGLWVAPAVLGNSFPLWALGVFGVGWLFSSTWPTYYAQVSRLFPHHPQMLDYGTGLGNALGIALCVYASAALAERWPPAALLSGVVALWGFGVLYYLTPLSRAEPTAISPD